MTLQVCSIDDIPRDEWSILTEDSLFSSPGFTSLWGEFGGKPVFLIMEHQGKLQAGMAAVTFGPKYLRRFRSHPESLYGGPFFAHDLTVEDQSRFYQGFASYLRMERIIRADIYNPPADIEMESFERRETSSSIISLHGDSYLPPNKRIRRYVRHAKRENVKLAILDDGSRLNEIYRLVLATAKRHNHGSRFSLEFFRRLLEISLTDARILWPIILHNDRITATHIAFVERDQLLDWQSHTDTDDSSRPNHLIYDFLIDYALSHGIKRINLGGTPVDAAGVSELKARWGGERSIHSYFTYFSRLGHIIYGLKRR